METETKVTGFSIIDEITVNVALRLAYNKYVEYETRAIKNKEWGVFDYWHNEKMRTIDAYVKINGQEPNWTDSK